jgi:rhamnose utilization protein RhaD (predicted bifunctional aldolase and dehydrogenase)
LETIEAPGFSPVHLDHLIRLASLAELSDLDMVNELRAHMTLASAPTPSVEAILHATLPYRFVDHTHADAIVTITNTANGLDSIKEIYGDDVVIIPYIMPGFDLARDCAARFAAEAGPNTLGMVLLNHGIFSFGDNARESYERMIALVDRAEDYIKHNKAWQIDYQAGSTNQGSQRLKLVRLRHDASKAAGFPLILSRHTDERSMNFVAHPDLAKIANQGPATPDHVIRTKQLPLIGTDTDAYADQYRAYFAEHAPNSKVERTMLDPAPRLALDPELGLCTLGRTAKDADIVFDIYEHTMDIILRA